MITLKPITITSPEMPTCIALDVVPHKNEDDHVSTNAITLARAHVHNKNGRPAECRAIYDGEHMVGLITYNYFANHPIFKEVCYRIHPIMVDKNHQNKGYEATALNLLLSEIETKPHGKATAIFATYNPSEDDCATIYTAANFSRTDLNWAAVNPDNNDIIVKRPL
ncbi:MAG: hypothetical protein FWC73_08390 [Defluviitaleaceae bacterium]|nr:hypothetical protein [Defluviitaleaceae bacterium]